MKPIKMILADKINSDKLNKYHPISQMQEYIQHNKIK